MPRMAVRFSSRQSGQSMTEFIIIVPVAFLLIFGCLQFALIYQAKAALNYAAFSAARVASVHHGQFDYARRGFAIGMAPFFAYDNESMVVEQAVRVVDSQIANGYVKIIRVNPTTAAFGVFGEDAFKDNDWDDDPAGQLQIPNGNLLYRNNTVRANVNIQDANLLKIGIVYCFHLTFPFIREAIHEAVMNGGIGRNGGGDFDHDCRRLTPVSEHDEDMLFIPIRASAIVRMQNAAWEDAAAWSKSPPYGASARNFFNLGAAGSGGATVTENPEEGNQTGP